MSLEDMVVVLWTEPDSSGELSTFLHDGKVVALPPGDPDTAGTIYVGDRVEVTRILEHIPRQRVAVPVEVARQLNAEWEFEPGSPRQPV